MTRTIAGTMKWGVWGAQLPTSRIEDLITGCIENGVTAFDHADIYGGYTTEEAWGEAWNNLHLPRSSVRITTKCGICLPTETRPQYSLHYYDATADHIIDSAKRSIENLQCEYLDVLLFHRPSPLMNPKEMAAAFSQLESEGLVRSFGVSNFTISQMELIRTYYPIAVNQIEVSMLYLDPFLDGTIDYCMTHGIEVQAWSPLGGGQLFAKSADYEFVTRRALLKEIADRYAWELDEMAYLFLLHHPARIRPVTGTSKLDRIIKAHTLEQKSISDATWFEIWTASMGEEVP